MHKKVLVVAAHPDDEALGCAGTTARHIDNGDEVHVVFMSDGVSSRDGNNRDFDLERRRKSANCATQLLGIKDSHFLDLPDNKMDSVPLLDIIQLLETVINKIKPEVIYTHFPGDLNIDHKITHRAVLTACRPQLYTSVKEIYC